MKLSIVSTLFLSESYINEFYERVSNIATNIVGDEFEIIFVDDGSPDNSLDIACQIAKQDSRLKVIELSRNFGHHKAMMTGLKHVSGDLVFLLDSDLEERPEYLKDFFEEMKSTKADVIFGVQDSRKGQKFEKFTGAIFWKFIRLITGLPFQKNLSTVRLMTRDYVNALIQHNEHEIFIAGLWLITGFKQNPLPITKSYKRKTAYSFSAKVSLLINSVTSFSNKPLIVIFYAGCLISILSLSYIFYLIYCKLFLMQSLPGWTSVMASVWLLGGLIISFLGIIGIYLSKIFIETKNRPYSLIKKIHYNE
jgi:putative glycosyltransferase